MSRPNRDFVDLRPASAIGRPVTDLTGQRFGRLVALSLLGVSGEHAVWACECDCGVHLRVAAYQLRRLQTTHCGCSHGNATHRQTTTPTYGSYTSMLNRCHCPGATNYRWYGGRGIQVCDRWRFGEDGLSGFECFLLDMGPRPDGLTIDRRETAGNYEPGNCRWPTWKEQANNRRPRAA